MTESNKIISKLFGKDLTSMMHGMLYEFKSLDYDEQQIMKMLRGFNESVRTAMYLLSLEKNYDAIAYRINRVNKKLNIMRKEAFIEAYENKKRGEPKLPASKPRFSRNASDYDLHERQVGCRSWSLLLPTSIHRQSVDGRSANRAGNLTSQIKNVGPKGHATHQAGNSAGNYSSSSSSA